MELQKQLHNVQKQKRDIIFNLTNDLEQIELPLE
jgi:hypothetical protein